MVRLSNMTMFAPPDVSATRVHPVRSNRLAFTMIEILLVVTVVAALFALAVPKFTTMRETTSARSSRLQLSSAFSSARAAAVQKGQPSTITIDGYEVTVTVLTGLNREEVIVAGPMRFDGTVGAKLTSIDGVSSIVYDPRGMVTPRLNNITRFVLSSGEQSDTLCISPSGLILPRDCRQ
jgi:type II secretory pathway pseudopilin PulG